MADRRGVRRVEILKIEGLGFLRQHLERTVVVSGGSEASKVEDLGFRDAFFGEWGWPAPVA